MLSVTTAIAEVSVETELSDEAVYSKQWFEILKKLREGAEDGKAMPWMEVEQNIEVCHCRKTLVSS